MVTRSSPDYEVTLHRDVAAAAEPWARLEASGWLTPYQRRGWAQAWLETIGAAEGVEPLIVEIGRGGAPVALLPLGMARATGCRIAFFLGRRHNNYNMPLYAEAGSGPTADDWRGLLGEVARRAGIDIFEFANQPRAWRCADNALAGLDSSHAASPSYVLRLSPDFEALAREKRSAKALQQLRRKARKLEERLGEVRFATAVMPGERVAVLEAMESHRRDRAATAGVPSFFDVAGAADFTARTASEGELRLDYLSAGGTIVAAYAGAVHGGRYSCFLNSFLARDGLDAVSPGDQMLHHLIERVCAEGLTDFDLGIGTERYKLAWCEPEMLSDATIAFTARGRMRGIARRGVNGAKRRIKNSPALWGLWKRLRPRRESAAAD